MPFNLNKIRQRPAVSEIRFLAKEREQTLYVSQWLWAKQTVGLIDTIAQQQRASAVKEKRKPSPRLKTDSPIFSTKLTKNKWGFTSWVWNSIIKDFQTEEKLYTAIKERRRQISNCRESWRSLVQMQQNLDPFYLGLSQLANAQTAQGTYEIPANQMELSCEGISGTYFLSDNEEHKRFVIKPIDEDIGCLNNGKGFASPYIRSMIRDNMPLYLSSMRETVTYEIANKINCANIAPRTVLAILESGAFNDQIDHITPDERVRYEQLIGSIVREKLCSVQEFIPNSKTLFEGLQDLQMAELSDDEVEARFDQRDFEDANILLWTTYDTDAHLNNFLVYPKSTDAIGNEILGIKKIDNGLTFPEKNEQLRNNLRYLPNSRRCLSIDGRAKIAALSVEMIADQLNLFGLSDSISALRQRLTVLKELAKRQNLTLSEIDYRMSLIGKPNGVNLALGAVKQ